MHYHIENCKEIDSLQVPAATTDCCCQGCSKCAAHTCSSTLRTLVVHLRKHPTINIDHRPQNVYMLQPCVHIMSACVRTLAGCTCMKVYCSQQHGRLVV